MSQHCLRSFTLYFRLMIVLSSLSVTAIGEEFPTPLNSEKSTTSPMVPEEVVKAAKLPEGFHLSVFAAEPDVQNPIAITTDHRGRIWVAENYSWSGSNLGDFNKNQRDRIVILEDTNR
ncbi:MAG: hypothetical protein FJ267_10970 [Planctomycetes bacterium]|nr:hypothetical protein [Planctomycetota bacterium]